MIAKAPRYPVSDALHQPSGVAEHESGAVALGQLCHTVQGLGPIRVASKVLLDQGQQEPGILY